MPTIGLLSDSHGRTRTTQRAVELLLTHNVDLILHLGDIGSVEVIDTLAVVNDQDVVVPARIVFGNTDWDLKPMADYARELDIAVDDPCGTVDVGDGELVFCHGHESAPMSQALARGAQYLCHGHSHRTEDYRQGQTRILNPGALFRASRYTVGVLVTETDRWQTYEVDGS